MRKRFMFPLIIVLLAVLVESEYFNAFFSDIVFALWKTLSDFVYAQFGGADPEWDNLKAKFQELHGLNQELSVSMSRNEFSFSLVQSAISLNNDIINFVGIHPRFQELLKVTGIVNTMTLLLNYSQEVESLPRQLGYRMEANFGSEYPFIDASVVMVGEDHVNETHKSTAEQFYLHFNTPKNCFLIEGYNHSALVPCGDLSISDLPDNVSKMRCDGWDNKSHPFWKAIPALSKTVLELYDFHSGMLNLPILSTFQPEVHPVQCENSTLGELAKQKHYLLPVPRHQAMYVYHDFKKIMYENWLSYTSWRSGWEVSIRTLKYAKDSMNCSLAAEVYFAYFTGIPCNTPALYYLRSAISVGRDSGVDALTCMTIIVDLSKYMQQLHTVLREVDSSFWSGLSNLVRSNFDLEAYDAYILPGRNVHAKMVIKKHETDCEKIFMRGGWAHFFGPADHLLSDALNDTKVVRLKPN